jgi:glycosyltransferase involved in cell wall biosynthesis
MQSIGSKSSPLVSVIIPTLADRARATSLLRAITSIKSQDETETEVIVVVNGQRHDPILLSELQARSDIRVVRLMTASLVAALYKGRTETRTPFFSFLDDDDEYLPRSLANRVRSLQSNRDCIMAVSPGYREMAGKRTASAYNLTRAKDDPYGELAANNWMTSCGALFRSSLAPAETFAGIPPHHEWTYLAYKLLALGPFCVADEPAYVIHDTPDSLSKTSAYSEAHANVLREVLRLSLPPHAVHTVKERLSRAEHDLASSALARGLRGKAIGHHLRSLLLPGGLRHLTFTRHLF